CGMVPYFLFRRGAMGGGDVKLLAALGALCTWPPGPHSLSVGLEAELYGFLAASLYALAKMAYEGKLLRVLGRTAFLCLNPVLPERLRRDIAPELMTSVRLGGAIFAGVVV